MRGRRGSGNQIENLAGSIGTKTNAEISKDHLHTLSIPCARIWVELDSPKALHTKSTAITSVVNFTVQKRDEVKPHESETRFAKLKRAHSSIITLDYFGYSAKHGKTLS